MSVLLALDTSTPNCSVAIIKEGNLLAFSSLSIGLSHSSHLTKLIDQLLDNVGVSYSDLSVVAVSEGPGSYTGLRIGVSVAKGLCFAYDLALVAVPTLDAMVFNMLSYASGSNVLLVPMLDARRMEVYTKVMSSDFKEVEAIAPKILDSSSYSELLSSSTVWFIGDGAQKFSEICESSNAKYFPEASPDAKSVGLLGYKYYSEEQVVDVAYFEPFYLKEFYTKAKV